MKKTLITIFTLCGILTAQAQIVLDSSHVASINETIIQTNDTMPTGITYGANGSGPWDFSMLDSNVYDTLRFLAISDPRVQGAVSFPNANVAIINSSLEKTSIFLNKTNLNVELLGQSLLYIQPIGLVDLHAASELIKFSSSMGDNYSGSSVGTAGSFRTAGLIWGIDSVKLTRNVSYTSTIDGEGEVITPRGSFNALRQLYEEVTSDTAYEKPASTGKWRLIDPITLSTINNAFPTLNLKEFETKTTQTARWWSDDVNARFPVVEMRHDAAGNATNVTWLLTNPTPTAIAENFNPANVALYPNPSNANITIKTDLVGNKQLQIFDVTGKAISTHAFLNTQLKISVDQLNNGIYFYNILDKNGVVLGSNKFLVSK